VLKLCLQTKDQSGNIAISLATTQTYQTGSMVPTLESVRHYPKQSSVLEEDGDQAKRFSEMCADIFSELSSECDLLLLLLQFVLQNGSHNYEIIFCF
jgi:hypothetical protein